MILALGLMAPLLAGTGCTRRFYREKADKEVVQVLSQKDVYPQWKIENWHVYPDPRARFADNTNPDRPPMPPDDPAAYDLSPDPQKSHHRIIARTGGVGYLAMLKQWDAENRAAQAAEKAKNDQDDDGWAEESEPRQEKPQPEEKPRPPEKLPAPEELKPPAKPAEPELPKTPPTTTPRTDAEATGRAPYLITLEQAVELGLINSREYQDRREDLYLAALPVTTERFAFSAQFFAAEQAFRQWAGHGLPEAERNRWQLNGQAGFTKVFPTGALLLLRFANQTVINLPGTGRSRGTTSTSTLGLDIVQPLLRGGGRAVTLEPLTQSERNLLYEIRDYARFRKEFYVGVATGQAFTSGAVGVPGAFAPGGGGLITGLGLALRPDIVPGSAGLSGPIAISGLGPQGYLPVVLLKAQLENERQNLEVLRTAEEQFRNLYRAQLVDQAQFNQVRQQRLGSETTVFQRTADYGNAIDRFKLQMGVPTDLPLEVDDTPLKPMLRQVEAYEEVYGFRDPNRETPLQRSGREMRELLIARGLAPREGQTMAAEQLDSATLRRRLRELVRTAEVLRGTPFPEEFLRRWAAWEKIGTPAQVQDRRDQLGDERRQVRAQQLKLEETGKPIPEDLQRRLEELDFEIELGGMELRLRLYEQALWRRPGADPTQQRFEQESQYRDVLAAFAPFLREAREEVLDRPRRQRLKQVQDNWPDLPRVCVDGVDLLTAPEEEALMVAARHALDNRFDLMNVRAQLVDSWRKIAVAANSLLGTFNVEYNLESFTPGSPGLTTNGPGGPTARPLAFAGSRTRHQLILNGELPIVRLLERNQYRATLIGYQRQRRALMEAEDLVLATVRAEVRQLRNLARNYDEVQRGYRKNLDLAYFQVDLASEFIKAPPAPTGGQPPTGTVGPPTAGRGAGGDPVALTQQYTNALGSLVRAKNTLYQVWIDYQANRLALFRDLELMPLDFRGVWIDDSANCLCGAPHDRPSGDGAGGPRPGTGPEGDRGP